MSSQATIIKVDGTPEPFDAGKLMRSLRRSGAQEQTARDITTHIEAEMHDGMTTNDIYRHARALLKKRQKTTAAKYSLRRALFNLGPTGFPFEHFLAELYRARGYTTRTGVVLRGTCVEHEVDLIAHNDSECIMAEAKFHSRPGVRSDLQVALYSYARFQDLKGKHASSADRCGISKGLIITNTKFTKAAIEYATCMGMELLSWNYPREQNLQAVIEEAGIYPITTLPSLTTREKQLLLEHGIVLCRDLARHRDTLRSLGFSPRKLEQVVAEGTSLCSATS